MPELDESMRPLLYRDSDPAIPETFDHWNLTSLRKVARTWLSADQATRLPKEDLVEALRAAIHSRVNAQRIFRDLSADELEVAGIYQRYGGAASGDVILIELKCRGLREIIETKVSAYHSRKTLKKNPVASMVKKWVLIPEARYFTSHYYEYHVGREDVDSVGNFILSGGIRELVTKPVKRAVWRIAAADGVPERIETRSAGEVALELSRVYGHLAGRASLKVRKDGAVSLVTLRSLEKALPSEATEYSPPDRNGLYFEILRSIGLIRSGGNEAVTDSVAAGKLFSQSNFAQVRGWIKGWLSVTGWIDGQGVREGTLDPETTEQILRHREVLAWTLGCLAHAGEQWFELNTFIEGLYGLVGSKPSRLSYMGTWKWDPELRVAKPSSAEKLDPRFWYERQGVWFANALMITLVELGVVDRGRIGNKGAGRLVFRLNPLGRAVFGGPEIAPPAELAHEHCLVVQPNFDIVAYTAIMDARTAGILGRIAETGPSGSVQTFRLTQTSVYRAAEEGFGHEQIITFLKEHSRIELPVNVARSITDWSVKRESLVLRSGVSFRAFGSLADRDAYLIKHAGTACGERFVISKDAKPAKSAALMIDHRLAPRQTLELDEAGHIRTSEPLDLVQKARLGRISRSTATGWQLTADSLRKASAAGFKPTLVNRWLADHLSSPVPPLLALSIEAWLGKGISIEMGKAVLIHIPDDAQFRTIAGSSRLSPFFLGSPGPEWLAVKPECVRELTTAFEQMGFKLQSELTYGPVVADTRFGSSAFAEIRALRKKLAARYGDFE